MSSYRLERNGRFLWNGECIGLLLKRHIGTKHGDIEWQFKPYKGNWQRAMGLTKPITSRLRNDVIEEIRKTVVARERLLSAPEPNPQRAGRSG